MVPKPVKETTTLGIRQKCDFWIYFMLKYFYSVTDVESSVAASAAMQITKNRAPVTQIVRVLRELLLDLSVRFY